MQVLQGQAENNRTGINYIIKLGVSALLLFLIFRAVDLNEALASLSKISVGIFALALVLQISSNSVAAYRWYLIMRRIGSSQNFFFYLKSYFKGCFFNQGLPTSIGGDAIRILDCSREPNSPQNAFYGVFIDRFVGLAGLLVLNIGALFFSGNILPPHIRFLLLSILTVMLAVLVILLYLRKFNVFTRTKWLGFLGHLSERYAKVYSTPASIIIQLGLSVIIHLMAMTAYYFLGVSVGLDYHLSVYLVLVPPVILLIILPISFAGWGIREGAMMFFFLLVGADGSKVFSLSIMYGITNLIGSLPGLFVYLVQKNRL